MIHSPSDWADCAYCPAGFRVRGREADQLGLPCDRKLTEEVDALHAKISRSGSAI